MGNVASVQSSFLGGEWAPEAQGRFGDPRYRAALNRCLNTIPVAPASAVRRFGFRTMLPTHRGHAGKLLPFIKGEDEAYNVELTDGIMRVLNRGRPHGTEFSIDTISTAANSYLLVTQPDHAFVVGDMVELEFFSDALRLSCARLVHRQFYVMPVDANSYHLRDSITEAVEPGGITAVISTDEEALVRRMVVLATPFTDDRWESTHILQSDDRTVLLQGSTPIQEITPTTINPVLLVDGPYLDPIPNTELTPSGLTGEVDMTLAFTVFAGTRSYSLGDYVTAGGIGYRSIQDLNLNHTPSSNPLWWTPVLFSEVINDGAGFGPTDGGRHIRLFSEPALWDQQADYAAGDRVTYNSTYWTALTSMTSHAATDQPGIKATTWVVDPTAARWTWGKIVASESVLIPNQLDPATGTTIKGAISNPENAFDGDTTQNNGSCASASPGRAFYLGKNWGSPLAITTARVYPSKDKGLCGSDQDDPAPRAGTAYLYASHTAPSSGTNGTLLGSVAFAAGETGGKTITSNDGVTTWEFVWIYVTGSSWQWVAEIEFFGGTFGAQGASITVQIIGDPLLHTTPIRVWRLGLFNNVEPKWPTNGCYHQGRFWLAGAVKNRVDASKSNDELNFAPTAPSGALADNNAISYTFNFAQKNQIIWMKPDSRGVLCGTAGAEVLIHATDNNNLISPTSIQADQLSSFGCADVVPVHTGLTTVFVNKYPQMMHEGLRDAYAGVWVAPELTEVTRHITKTGIRELAYTTALSPIVWGRTADGALFGTTYQRTNLVSQEPPAFNAFHRHELGSGRPVTAVCEAYSIVGETDTLAIITKAAGDIHYVEFGTHFPQTADTIFDADYLDSADVPAAATISSEGLTLLGLNHLEGETVSAFVAGLDCGGEFTVTNGSVLVPFGVADGLFTEKYVKELSASGRDFGDLRVPIDSGAFQTCATVGFSFTSQGQLLRPIAPDATGAQNGPALGKTRRNHQFGMLLHNAQGVSIGTEFGKLRPIKFRTKGARTLTPIELFSGVATDTVEDENTLDGMLAWEISRPYPASVLAIGGFLATQDK